MSEPCILTAAVCAYNPPPVWKELVRIIIDEETGSVVVVDDGSTTPLVAPSDSPSVDVLRLETNRGLSHARNRATERATTDWILFLDADVLPAPGFASKLTPILSQTQADGIGFSVREHNRSAPWDRLRAFERDVRVPIPGKREWLSGLFVAYRRDALLDVGGFDENLRTNGEDVDIGYRLTKRGYRLEQADGLWGEHHRKDSFRSCIKYHYRYALTGKIVDRALYGLESTTEHAHVPWLHMGEAMRVLSVYGKFVLRNPHMFYMPPLALIAKLAGSTVGAFRVRRQRPISQTETSPDEQT